jgi:hypothetical protein
MAGSSMAIQSDPERRIRRAAVNAAKSMVTVASTAMRNMG